MAPVGLLTVTTTRLTSYTPLPAHALFFTQHQNSTGVAPSLPRISTTVEAPQ
jgi:hypothetical protein